MTASNGLPSAHAVEIAVRREAAVTQLMMLLPDSGLLEPALTEARRRSEMFQHLRTSTRGRIPDPYSAGLESVLTDVQKGLFG